MSEVDVDRLRALRRRAYTLLNTLEADLKYFQHSDPTRGFVRKPDSDSSGNDTNVTTTGSCLMALALCGRIQDFYGDGKKTASEIFWNIVSAPWMSSGLAENNAFTTTLVIRTFGLLVENGVIESTAAVKNKVKLWELYVPVKDPNGLASKLANGQDKLSRSIFDLLSRNAQIKVTKAANSPVSSDDGKAALAALLARELDRIARTASFRALTEQADESATRQAESLQGDYDLAQLNRRILHEAYADNIDALAPLSLTDIASRLSETPENSAKPDHFRINNYPPAAAVIYWFVDGVHRGHIDLEPRRWQVLCDWAASEFARQRSLVVARHAAMMDPVSMGMAACLCARLRAISSKGQRGMDSAHQAGLPSVVELEESILELFAEQTESGIWPKYFPLFHYQEAGSNFCFTFELLEAVLTEFSQTSSDVSETASRLFGNDNFLRGLERAVTWCETNRLEFPYTRIQKQLTFRGWNSGGSFETLRQGQPESWATAVVHMFLWELTSSLSQHIQSHLMTRYRATRPRADWRTIDAVLDIDLWLGKPIGLKALLSQTIVEAFKNADADTLRKKPRSHVPLSALLFGPPGTSKTEITKAVAATLGWPIVEIDPSHFLRRGYQNIYVEAEHIFEDVMDLSGVVVLFDEMDALVQKRNGHAVLDTESKFLTTYMLPKLAKLHDAGRVVFFMATNFQQDFDDAIKRAGRFDFLLCMGPPTLEDKCKNIHVFFGAGQDETKGAATEQTLLAGQLIRDYCSQDQSLRQQLELYTFGEFKSFITRLDKKAGIGDRLQTLGLANFSQAVIEDSLSVGLKMTDLRPVLEAMGAKTLAELDSKEIDLAVLEAKHVSLSAPAVRYAIDRQQSRRQCARLASESL